MSEVTLRKQKLRKNTVKTRLIIFGALAVLLVLGIVGGTAAYNTQTKQAVNEFRTGEYATELVEEFIPPSDWQPGISVNKDVKVRNTGTVPVFASIKLHQSWVRQEDVTDIDGNVIPPNPASAATPPHQRSAAFLPATGEYPAPESDRTCPVHTTAGRSAQSNLHRG